MKKYRKNHPARIPARGAAETRHLTARSGLEVLYYQMVQSLLVQRERRNDLPELTPARARELYEAYRRGEMADVQLMWDQLEERDETLFTVLHARLGALAEMPWTVNIDADLSEDKQALAEQQKELANKLLAAVENLPEALTHLGMADFRGVAALEVTGNAQRMRWEVIEPWNLCRPVRRGPWLYNEEASATPARLEELEPERVIVREAMPIDLPAMFLICAKYLSVHAWDAFLEVFGIPNVFLEMPPATPEDKALEFDAIVQRLIGEGRGTVPSGAKFHTVETSKDNTQSFEARARWCNEAIIQLATGGLLTVTTQSGSGTLAGNAHSDSFGRLCAASARSISAAINRQFLRPSLQAAYPHSPILVRFELAPEPVDDRLQVAQLIATLASAGYRAKDDDVAELMNMQFTAANMNPTDLYATKAVGYVPTMEAMQTRLGMPLKPAPVEGANSAPMVQNMQHIPITNTAGGAVEDFSTTGHDEPNSTTERDAGTPLSSGELAALRMLGGELNAAQVAADAEYAAGALLGAVRPNGKKVVTNKCTVDNDPERCRCKGKLQRKPAQTASERAQRTAEMEAAGMSDDEIYAEQRQYLLDDSTMREVVDYKHRRSAEIRRLRDKFQNKKVERQDKKLPVIEITKKGIKEMTTDKALDKSVRMGCSVREHEEAVNRVDELLRDGIVTETRDGGQGRHAASDHVLKVSTLKSSYKSTESGELCTAVFSVHEEKDSPPYAYFMYAKKERPKQ